MSSAAEMKAELDEKRDARVARHLREQAARRVVGHYPHLCCKCGKAGRPDMPEGGVCEPCGGPSDENARQHLADAEAVCAKKVEMALGLFPVLDDLYMEACVAAGFDTPMYHLLQQSWAQVEAGLDMLRRAPK